MSYYDTFFLHFFSISKGLLSLKGFKFPCLIASGLNYFVYRPSEVHRLEAMLFFPEQSSPALIFLHFCPPFLQRKHSCPTLPPSNCFTPNPMGRSLPHLLKQKTLPKCQINPPTNPIIAALTNLDEKGHCCFPISPEELSTVLLSHRMSLSLPGAHTPHYPVKARSQKSWRLSSSPFASPKFPCAFKHCWCALN